MDLLNDSDAMDSLEGRAPLVRSDVPRSSPIEGEPETFALPRESEPASQAEVAPTAIGAHSPTHDLADRLRAIADELQALLRAPDVPEGTPIGGSSSGVVVPVDTTGAQPKGLKLQDLVLLVLSDDIDRPLANAEIAERIAQRWDYVPVRTSIPPCLSRMEKKGLVARADQRWRLNLIAPSS